MSENKDIVSGDDKAEIADTESQNTLEDNQSEAVTHVQSQKHENGSLDGSVKIPDKRQQHPQYVPTRTMMPGLPPIDLNQLTSILRDPSMPSQEIMKEVADKFMLRCEESESDDNSLGSTGGMVGMRGLLDCIFEVTIQRPDSDNSDDDETFQRIPREIPCSFCNKIFGSTMRWKTHVLVAHQDPSVLNIRRLSTSEGDKKDKSNTSHRRYSRYTSKPDPGGTDTKTCLALKTDSKQIAEACHKEENVSENQRQCSILRSVQTVKSDCPFEKHHMERQIPQVGNEDRCSSFSSESGQKCKDELVDICKVIDNINSTVSAGSLQIQESAPRNIGSAEDKEEESLPVEVCTEPQTFEQGPNINPCHQKMMEGKQGGNSNISDKSATIDVKSGGESVGGRKRKSTLAIQASTTSTSLSSASNSKRSRTYTEEESRSSSVNKLE